MGTALGFTVCAIIITIGGCFGALSSDPEIIKATYWGVTWAKIGNFTIPSTADLSDRRQGVVVRFGLATTVSSVCKSVDNSDLYWDWTDCVIAVDPWVGFTPSPDWPADYADAMNRCKNTAIGDGSLMSYVGSQQVGVVSCIQYLPVC